MKKFLVMLLITFSLVSLYGQSQEKLKAFYVKATGDDNNNGRSEDSAFRTLKKAVEMTEDSVVNNIVIVGTLNTQSEMSRENAIFWIMNKKGEDLHFIGKDNAKLSADGEKKKGLVMASTSANSTLSFENIEFSGTSRHSSCAFMITRGNVNFSNCKFTNNNTAAGGVAINADHSQKVIIQNCEFSNNSLNGKDFLQGKGIIYISRAKEILIADCLFSNNKSDNDGTCINVFESEKFELKKCTFQNNESTASGGCVYTEYSYTDISDCIFENNKAIKGGAVFIYRVPTFSINNSVFKQNRANNGGALAVQELIKAPEPGEIYIGWPYHFDYAMKLQNTTFEDNYCTFTGGAIYIDSKNTRNIDFKDIYIPDDSNFEFCKFEKNIAGDEVGNDYFILQRK